jgi:hypothetical protein
LGMMTLPLFSLKSLPVPHLSSMEGCAAQQAVPWYRQAANYLFLILGLTKAFYWPHAVGFAAGALEAVGWCRLVANKLVVSIQSGLGFFYK